MSAVLAFLAVSSAPVSLGCNVVSADGVAKHFELRLDQQDSAVELIHRLDGASVPVDAVHFEENGTVRFTATLDGKQLEFRLWGGFHRERSTLDGVDLDSSSASFRLPYVAGICDVSTNVTPVASPLGQVGTREGQSITGPGCPGVTLRGDVFTLRFRNVEDQLLLNLEGEGFSDFVDRPLSKSAFPSLPENEQTFASWTGYQADDDGEPVSLVLEFTVNKNTLLQANVADFQEIGIIDAPLMVARAHCGFTPTETR